MKRFGTRFDPCNISSLVESAGERGIFKIPTETGTNMVEIELSLNDLKEGMLLSRGVKSGTGIILLSKGTTLKSKNIQALRRYYQLDPSETGIFVLVKR